MKAGWETGLVVLGKDVDSSARGFVLLLLCSLLIAVSPGRSSAQVDCSPWLQAKSWTGTFSQSGTGSEHAGTTFVTMRESVSGTITLDDHQSPCYWEGRLSASYDLFYEIRDSCAPFDPVPESVLTARGSGSMTGDAALWIDPPFYFLSAGSFAVVDVQGLNCDGSFDSGIITMWPWGPADLPSFFSAGGIGSVPLPTSGSVLSGSYDFQALGVTGVMADWQQTWNLSPKLAPDDTDDNPCLQPGSIIACQNQTLGEAVAIVGTPFRLHYQSDRVPGRSDANSVAVAHARTVGGWTLNIHHAYDPAGNILFLGNGGRRSADLLGSVIQTTAGEFLIAAEDGSEVYVFVSNGRHLRTLHGLTAAVLYEFGYDPAARLKTITDGDGNVTTIQRDSSGKPAAIVSPFRQSTRLQVDSDGFLAGITDPAKQSVQFTYSLGGLLVSLTTPRGHVQTFTYDTAGRLVLAEDAVGGFKALSRTDTTNGHIVAFSTALGRTTTYQAENPAAGGRRWVNTFPDGLQKEWINGADDTRTGNFPNGMADAAVLGPDPRWDIQAPVLQSRTITTPGGLVWASDATRSAMLANPHDPFSLTNQTDTLTINGNSYSRYYDAASRTFSIATPEGRERSITIDAKGRVARKQVAGLSPVDYVYDSRGRPTSITHGTGLEARSIALTYDAKGNLSKITDPLNRAITFKYDAAGRVTTQTLPGGRKIAYTYDASGNVTGITTPARKAHKFSYTPVDLRSAYVPPAVGSGANETTYTYDADRELTGIARPDGQSVTFGYDTAGRLTSLNLLGGQTEYTYHPTTGGLHSITSPSGVTTTYSYDGALQTGESWTGAVAGNVNFSYDANFSISTLTVNNSDAVTFEYDHDALLTQAGALTIVRDSENGLPVSTVLGAVTDGWRYNSFGEPVEYSVSQNGTPLYTVRYTRDKLGRITQKTETVETTTNVFDYVYDLAGRLTAVKETGTVTAAYSYDKNGNRLTISTPRGKIKGTYDAQDRLTSLQRPVALGGNVTYAYTAHGELQSKTVAGQTTHYQYDALGALLKVVLSNGTEIEYLIDGRNRRVGKKFNGTLVQSFLYENQLRPFAELDSAGQVISRFVYASRVNVPDYMIKSGVTYRIITDQLGSPRLVVDATTGQIVQRMDYDEFGNVLTDTNPGFQPFGFAGGLYDPDTGLIRFGARDYDSEIGRWLLREPLLFGGGQTNLYAFVESDPINLIDPTGLIPYNITDPSHPRFVKLSRPIGEPHSSGGVLIGWTIVNLWGPGLRQVIVKGLDYLFPPEKKGIDKYGAVCHPDYPPGRTSPYWPWAYDPVYWNPKEGRFEFDWDAHGRRMQWEFENSVRGGGYLTNRSF